MRAAHGFFHGGVPPYWADSLADIAREDVSLDLGMKGEDGGAVGVWGGEVEVELTRLNSADSKCPRFDRQ